MNRIKIRILKLFFIFSIMHQISYSQTNVIGNATSAFNLLFSYMQGVDQIIADSLSRVMPLHSMVGSMDVLNTDGASFAGDWQMGFAAGLALTFPFVEVREIFRIYDRRDIISESLSGNQFFDSIDRIGLPIATPYIVMRGKIAPKKAKSWLFPLDIFLKYGSTALAGNVLDQIGTDNLDVSYRNFFFGLGSTITIFKRDLFSFTTTLQLAHFEGSWSLAYQDEGDRLGIDYETLGVTIDRISYRISAFI